MNSDEEIPVCTDSNEDTASSGSLCSTSSFDDIEFSAFAESGTSFQKQNDIEDYPYDVLSVEQVVDYMLESINEVNSVLQLPSTSVRVLLNHFKWDKEKLMEQFYDGDQEQLFLNAKIVLPKGEAVIATKRRTNKATNRKKRTEECDICYMRISSMMMTNLGCDHPFCTQCWIDYLTTKIMEDGLAEKISCPAYGCDILVDDVTVKSLIKDSQVILQYQRITLNSFVENNRLLRWCPSPSCGSVIKVQTFEIRSVTCTCSYTFCFACGESQHDPVLCHQLMKWIKKCDDDSETLNWMVANTKDCPKCKATIEKNGGCNHMVCRNQSCRQEFCWVCLGLWEPHRSNYKCNRYDEDKIRVDRDIQERSLSALQKYLFHYTRYKNHMQSLKFEKTNLYDVIANKIMSIKERSVSWIEIQFLKNAIDTLCQCRRTLMYTYVFAFYLKKDNQSEIFQANQSDLEKETETLSGYLERDITCDNFNDLKQEIQDKYWYCESRRKRLLEHVYEGYENNFWTYID